MSREAFELMVQDYRTWDAADAYADKVCLYEVSKILRGEAEVVQTETQECSEPSKCKTLKRHSRFRMELEPGPCDSPVSKETLSGKAEGDIVGVFVDGDMTKRGGHTGAFRWVTGSSELVARMRGVSNAGTHHEPVDECEKCYVPGHAEGWLRAAVVEGHSEGCRVAGSYAMKFDISEGGTTFTGTLEGLLICQCSE